MNSCISMVDSINTEFDSLTYIFSRPFFAGMNANAESPLTASLEITFKTGWWIPVFSASHTESGNPVIPWSKFI